MRRIARVWAFSGLALTGCGDDRGSTDQTSAGSASGTGSSGDPGSETDTATLPTTSGTSTTTSPTSTTATTTGEDSTGGTTTGVGKPGLYFPQAVFGAMAADLTVYASLPVHLSTKGAVDAVTVQLDDGPEIAANPGAGTWVADVAIMGASEGVHTLTATASGPEGEAAVNAELVLRSGGLQWTDVTQDGNAGTPTLHRRPGEESLWLTWTDGSGGPNRRAWLEPLDGAGRSMGERYALTPADADVPYARVALGGEGNAVLYQEPGGGPYFNRLRIVDIAGAELLAPIDLEPPGEFGSFGGDVAYDGTGFVATFRSNDGMGGGDVWWIRVEEGTWAVTGPVSVAASGDGDPDGGFDPFSAVSIAAVDDTRSVITFVRERYNPMLDLSLPKTQVVTVTADGDVDGPDFVASGTDFQWHWEGRVEAAGDEVLLLWTTDDLNDPSPTIPTALRGARVAPGDVVGNNRGAGTILVQAPETRGEPAFVATEEAPGILVWTDQRSYVDIQNGRIELMATRIRDDALTTDTEDLIGHARFVAGTANLGGVPVGTNAVITWIDERHGGSIVNPKPEVYLETIWR